MYVCVQIDLYNMWFLYNSYSHVTVDCVCVCVCVCVCADTYQRKVLRVIYCSPAFTTYKLPYTIKENCFKK